MVTFYKINKNTGKPDVPVLYLDTLKVSTIEQTAETTDARGGKGNPKLVTWDYGKDITVTLEDALFSAKSLSIMFGDGTVNHSNGYVQRTAMVRAIANGALPDYFTADVFDAETGSSKRTKIYFSATNNEKDVVLGTSNNLIKVYRYTNAENEAKTIAGSLDNNGAVTTPPTYTATTLGVSEGDRVFITYVVPATIKEIVISGDTFPGTYYVTGDTYARSDIDGSDQFFQFIIQKAKVTSENTITLEAEGDPSVFNMNLTVLRPEDGEMMKLVQYDLYDPGSAMGLDL